MRLPIYMDYHATTPIDPRVLEAMMPSLTTEFGNAASRQHPAGLNAEKLAEKGRAQVAGLINADPAEIIFTSGATESDNLAIKGVAESCREKGRHIITQVTEHKAVLDTCRDLEQKGFRITYLPVDRTGRIRPGELEKAIDGETILISIMVANNEIGTLQPVDQIGEIARRRGVFFHADAAQAAGKIPVDVQKSRIDLLSLTAHKLYGPKGVGALYVRRSNPYVKMTPLIHGGGHERGLRSGTLNVPGIVGFGKACELAQAEMPGESERMRRLRDRLYDGIQNDLKGVHLNGHPSERLPHNLNVSFEGVEGHALLSSLTRGIAVSSGSACASANAEPSYVLKALGMQELLIHASVRFGLGRFNTEEEVDYAVRHVTETVRKMRAAFPLSANP